MPSLLLVIVMAASLTMSGLCWSGMVWLVVGRRAEQLGVLGAQQVHGLPVGEYLTRCFIYEPLDIDEVSECLGRYLQIR